MGKLFGCGGNFSVLKAFSAVPVPRWLMAGVQVPGGDGIVGSPVLLMQICPSAISTNLCIRNSVNNE